MILNRTLAVRTLVNIAPMDQRVSIFSVVISLLFAIGCRNRETSELKLEDGIIDGKREFGEVVKIRLHRAARGECTATKIQEKTFITAGHCLTGQEAGDVKPGEQLEIFYGFSRFDEPESYTATIQKIHIPPVFRASYMRTDYLTDSHEDVGVFVIENETPEIKQATLVNYIPQIDDSVIVVGWGQTRNRHYYYDQIAGNMNRSTKLKNRVNVIAGDSGGPIFAKNSDPQRGIIGIVNLRGSQEFGRQPSAVMISSVWSWLKEEKLVAE